ncbi:MAG: hypothetical protein KGI38_08945 [Thaumarchaeota archaeon]|nr:hypothetical protein [Nitrososphaerota archaeon]
MAVKAICPKCGREGTQYISQDEAGGTRSYLRFRHGPNDVCYIGRVRTTNQVVGELNKPETSDDFRAMSKVMVNELKELVAIYSQSKSGSVLKIVRDLQTLLEKYGY